MQYLYRYIKMGRTKKIEVEKTEKPEPKKRKTLSGPLRDKSRTMARLVAAVGKVIQKSGYGGLSAPSVATAAGLDKKLVWTYFGGLDNLVEEFIHQRDFWKHAAKSYIEDMLKEPEKIGKNEISGLLHNQLDSVLKDKILQKIIHWEIGENNKVLRKVSDKREEIGEMMFSAILPEFEKADVDLRSRMALLIGGIYYLSLHAKTNGSLFCGLDLNNDEDKQRIEKSIEDFVFETYQKANIDK